MSCIEAKEVIRNYFKGISQPTSVVCDALDIVSEDDYKKIYNEIFCKTNNERIK